MTTVDVHDYHLASHITAKSRASRIASFLLNYAGLLCLVDCIVLPVLITLMRVLDMFHTLNEWEHAFHIAEIVCVLPLGLVSVLVNYRKVKSVRLLTMGLLGISSIVGSHFFADGWNETVLSLLGCVMLVSSNHLAHRKHGCNHCDETQLTMVF